MSIEISLSPKDNGDWLASAVNGESVDIWKQMADAERKRRAKGAHVEALADQLATTDMGKDVAERVAKTFIEYLDETEYREIRRAALTDDSDGDYLDRLTTQFVQRLREYLHATQQARNSRQVVASSVFS
ncbi:hypothetical protein ACFQL1_09015 [Halomicroarcula sp. GCM10025709]|uniref:hypothetical protein n=1 Tax=Haloarcula TaxID=2237 RepID=UPI0024C2C6C4|nr:hypothetical protein [Halomicroarcula sp. YJ-61-S]